MWVLDSNRLDNSRWSALPRTMASAERVGSRDLEDGEIAALGNLLLYLFVNDGSISCKSKGIGGRNAGGSNHHETYGFHFGSRKVFFFVCL